MLCGQAIGNLLIICEKQVYRLIDARMKHHPKGWCSSPIKEATVDKTGEVSQANQNAPNDDSGRYI